MRHLILSGTAALLLALQPGPANAQSCEPIPVVELIKRLDAARKSIFLVKYDDAYDKLSNLKNQISCFSEVMPKEELARLYLYFGVIAFQKKDEPGAAEYFKRAVAVDRSTRWDERFGQKPRELYIEAKESSLLAPKCNIRVPELVEQVMVYIDGEPAAPGAAFSVSPGEHFIQYRKGEEALVGVFQQVTGGEDAAAPLPESYVKRPVVSVAEPDRGGDTGGGQPSNRPSEPEAPQEPFDPTVLRPYSYISLGLGAVSLLSGLGAGGYYWMTAIDLQNNYFANRDDEEKLAKLSANATAALVTNISFGGAVLFSGAGVALFYLSGGMEAGEAQPLSLMPILTPQTAGLSLSGRF